MFICSSTNGHLGSFHFLAFISNTVTNILVQVFVWTYVFHPRTVELLGHIVTLCLMFGGTTKLFPKWLHDFTFPPAMCEGLNFSTSLSILVTVSLIITILVGVKLYLIVVLNCISLMANDIEHLFNVLIGYLCIFFEKCLFKSFPHFYCCVVSIIYIYWLPVPNEICDLQIFCPILWVVFSLS